MELLEIIQFILGISIVASSILVILNHNPVVSALFLLLSLFFTGAFYFSLGSFFIGVVQILIYAGAIAVLFVFIVMLLDLNSFKISLPGRLLTHFMGVFVGVLFFVLVTYCVLEIPFSGFKESSQNALELSLTAKEISAHMLSKYMLAFQVASLLLLAAMVGVVLLGKPSNFADLQEKDLEHH